MIKADSSIEIACSTKSYLSSMSQRSRDDLLAVLREHYTRVGITIVNNLADLGRLVARRPDLVFMGLKFVPSNPSLGLQDPDKIWVAQYLDEHGIAYTGSEGPAHELELNKPLAKQRVLDVGVRTSPFCVANLDRPLNRDNATLEFPLFVKPTNRGGGLGIDSDSVVHTFDELDRKVRAIGTKLHADSLIEEYLPGREFSVALLREYSGELLVLPIEKVAPPDEHGERLLSGSIKSADVARDLIVSDKALKAKLISLAVDAFHALGARDYGRIDIRLDAHGTPHFLEANLLPSLIDGYGSFPKACALNIDLGYESMILQIVRLGLLRNLSENDVITEINGVSELTLEAAISQ